jgi:hypothetical protein
MDGHENPRLAGFNHPAFCGPQSALEQIFERIRADLSGFDEALIAALRVSHDENCAPGCAFRIERFEHV